MKKIVIGVIVIVILVTLIKIKQENKPVEYTTKEYVISSKETLWSIAERYAPEGMDIREYIYHIEEDNNIDSMVYSNQVITIRIYEERENN